MNTNNFKPFLPFNVKAKCFTVKQVNEYGVIKEKATGESIPFFCSFKRYGGKEEVINGIVKTISAVTIHCHYNKFIKQNSIIEIDGVRYRIISPIENVEMKNKFLSFKVIEL